MSEQGAESQRSQTMKTALFRDEVVFNFKGVMLRHLSESRTSCQFFKS